MIKLGRVWLFTLFLAGFWACGDDDSANANEEVTAEDTENVSSINAATITFSDAVVLSSQIMENEGVITGRTQGGCYTATETETENQLLVTFEQSCDGKVRSGSFLLEWEGSLQTNDFSYTVTFDGYKVNDYGLSGSITVSGLTYKQNGFGYNVVVTNGVVNCPDGKQINYEQDFDYDYTIGEITELRITGNSTGMGKEGNSYVANTREAILIQSGCDYAVSGSFDATFNGRPQVMVDYGDSTCDNKATVTRGDFSITIDLD